MVMVGGYGGMAPSASQSSAAAGLPFAGVPSELQEGADRLLETEPDHPAPQVHFDPVAHRSPQGPQRRFGLRDMLVPHRWAVGAGLEWAINCDLAVWGESARAFFPELEWGLFVTGAVGAIAPRQMSLSNFKELVLLREKTGAARLHELGLAWRVVPDGEVFDHAMAVAARVAELPPDGVVDFKRITNRAAYSDVETAMAMETEATIRGALAPAAAAEIEKFQTRKR